MKLSASSNDIWELSNVKQLRQCVLLDDRSLRALFEIFKYDQKFIAQVFREREFVTMPSPPAASCRFKNDFGERDRRLHRREPDAREAELRSRGLASSLQSIGA